MNLDLNPDTMSKFTYFTGGWWRLLMAILTSSAVAGLMAMSFTSSFGLHLAIYIPLFVLLLVLTVAFFRDLSRHSI